MNRIAGIPYFEARFDQDGTLINSVSIQTNPTHLFVIAHGWNNDAREARELYAELFTNLSAQLHQFDLAKEKCAVLGIIWPSKRFHDWIAVDAAPSIHSPRASLAGSGRAESALNAELESFKRFFPGEDDLFDQLKRSVPTLDSRASARRSFVQQLRTLLRPESADSEENGAKFFIQDGDTVMKKLRIDPDDLETDIIRSGGATAFETGFSSTGGAAGGSNTSSGFFSAALNVLNLTTYYEMKRRAGQVGTRGVALLLDRISSAVERIHLIGHSFGARLVTAAAANSAAHGIASLSLLQAAFSHFGFSKARGGFFRSLVAQKRVRGPILITHSKNDMAVGLAYPLASRLSGDKTMALGDENSEYGGLGRNGAQRMEPHEVDLAERELRPLGEQYQFDATRLFNLRADRLILNHGDVRSREVAQAILCAAINP